MFSPSHSTSPIICHYPFLTLYSHRGSLLFLKTIIQAQPPARIPAWLPSAWNVLLSDIHERVPLAICDSAKCHFTRKTNLQRNSISPPAALLCSFSLEFIITLHRSLLVRPVTIMMRRGHSLYPPSRGQCWSAVGAQLIFGEYTESTW